MEVYYEPFRDLAPYCLIWGVQFRVGDNWHWKNPATNGLTRADAELKAAALQREVEVQLGPNRYRCQVMPSVLWPDEWIGEPPPPRTRFERV